MNATVGHYDPNQTKSAVTFSAAALTHLKNQIKKQGHGIGVRLSLKKSGCTGYKHVVEIIDAVANNEEKIIIDNQFIVTVAKENLANLSGTHIDYIKKGLNAEFAYSNPNQTAMCGCGESVKFKDEK